MDSNMIKHGLRSGKVWLKPHVKHCKIWIKMASLASLGGPCGYESPMIGWSDPVL